MILVGLDDSDDAELRADVSRQSQVLYMENRMSVWSLIWSSFGKCSQLFSIIIIIL